MRRAGIGRVAAVLLLGLGASVAAAGEGEARGSWWNAWFRSNRAEPKKAEPAERPDPAADALREQQRQWNAYFRRQAACDRLREIAIRTNNAELEREAERLCEQAWEVYCRQLGKTPAVAAGDADTTLLGQQLKTTQTAERLTLPEEKRPREGARRAALWREEE